MLVRWLAAIWMMAVCAGAYGAGTGDPEAGKAQAVVCGACHGADGASGIDPSYPNLAGQNAKYLLSQLRQIRDGSRNVLLMAGQLTAKSDQDLEDLAAYYASLPGKVAQAEGDDEALARAEAIYRGGILDKKVAACTACHSPSAAGNAFAGFPRLAGQPTTYTVNQLKAFREGERRTDADLGGMMQDIAARLTDGEMRVLADYIRGLY